VLKVHRPHNGVDFAAPTGTPVRAVADGVIEWAKWINGGGKSIKIKHSDRWATAYMHLSKFSPNIRPGTRVSRGEVVGAVGMTGLATAPHLHFSLYDRGRYVNPLTTALPQMPNARPLPKDYLVATLQTLRSAHDALAEERAKTLLARRSVPEGRRKV
jgi:murein DD-endopeptidase MepM/ murein hydrolase activator NlpD